MSNLLKTILLSSIALQTAMTPVSAQSCSAPVPAPNIPKFVEETDSAGLQSRFEGEDEFMVGGGVATFDCDADGLPEIYVTAGVNKAKFYRNKSARGGAIKLQEERTGLELTNAIGAYPLDVDSDGNTDLVVLRVGEVEVFRGLGACKFERATANGASKQATSGTRLFLRLGSGVKNGRRLPIGTYIDRTKRQNFLGEVAQPGVLLRPNSAGNGFAAPVKLRAIVLRFVDVVFRLGTQRHARFARQQRPRILQRRARAALENCHWPAAKLVHRSAGLEAYANLGHGYCQPRHRWRWLPRAVFDQHGGQQTAKAAARCIWQSLKT